MAAFFSDLSRTLKLSLFFFLAMVAGSSAEKPATPNVVYILADLLATVADILGKPLPNDAGEDSVSMLPNLLGVADGPLREATVHHSINGIFAIRQGRWKLIEAPQKIPGSGAKHAGRLGWKRGGLRGSSADVAGNALKVDCGEVPVPRRRKTDGITTRSSKLFQPS